MMGRWNIFVVGKSEHLHYVTLYVLITKLSKVGVWQEWYSSFGSRGQCIAVTTDDTLGIIWTCQETMISLMKKMPWKVYTDHLSTAFPNPNTHAIHPHHTDTRLTLKRKQCCSVRFPIQQNPLMC